MELLSMNRWAEKDIQHFTLRVDFVVSDPRIVIEWIDDDKRYSSLLTVTRAQGDTIEGTIKIEDLGDDFIIDGTVGRISIQDGDKGFVTKPMEKPADKPKNKFIDFQYEEPLEVTHRYYFGMIGIINRIADYGGSGVSIAKTVADGWSLPGVLSPLTATEDRLKELLETKYDLESVSLNACYLVGDELVFLRSSPSKNELIRAKAADIYTMQVTGSIARYTGEGEEIPRNGTGRLEQSRFGGLGEEISLRLDYLQTPTPPVAHFKEELEAIFYDEIDYDQMLDYVGPYVLVPSRIQHRLASESYSIQESMYNYPPEAFSEAQDDSSTEDL
jgi:hypothetical protein